MITDGKKMHFLLLKSEPISYNGKLCNHPVKILSRLLGGKTSNHHGDFYCLNCFSSYSTENNIKEHEELFNKNDNCCIIMPSKAEKNIKIQSWRKIIKSSICNLS